MKKRQCKNCGLFNTQKMECRVAILHEGEILHLPVVPNDYCFFEQEFVENYVQQIRMWVEDPLTGQPATEGIVKIEYPVPEGEK